MRFFKYINCCFSGVFVFLALLCTNSLYANKYPQVFFSKSMMPGYYGYSLVSHSGYSWVENVKGRIPLSENIKFTPGNSISLRYTSSPMGYWEAELSYPSRERYFLDKNDEFLSFRLYIQQIHGLASLPKLKIQLADTCTKEVSIQKYIAKADTAEWIHVRIPVRDIGGLKTGDQIRAITFQQGGATGIDVVDHLYIDQIEFEQKLNQNKTQLEYPAILSKVQAYEKHVELAWQLPLNPGIRYVKVYRSIDNEHFEAVDLVPVFVTSYSDLVPETHRTYFYKIAWVDVNYEESPFSKVLEAKTRPMNEGAWLDLMQKSHIQFFVDRSEINSGMHSVSFDKQKVVVSVEETGYAILSKVVGVEREFVQLSVFVRNLLKLTDFLKKVDHHAGMFPRFLDGRTGKAVDFRSQDQRYHVGATSSLMMGLLVANQYLDRVVSDSPDFIQDKKTIQNTIKFLWERVNWTAYYSAVEGALYAEWDANKAFTDAKLLGGLRSDFMAYFLGASHQQHALEDAAYLNGVLYFRPEPILDIPYNEDDSSIQLTEWWSQKQQDNKKLGVVQTDPVYKDTIAYGLRFELGAHLERDLLETYMPFMVINPFTFQDSVMLYGNNLVQLTEAFRRRDNEMNAGVYDREIWGTSQGRSTLDWSAIVPAISVSSYVFQPEMALRSMKRLYLDYGKEVFTEAGFRSWFNPHENTVSESPRGLNQAMVVVMLENSRTGLIWDLFSEHPDMAKFFEKVNLYD